MSFLSCQSKTDSQDSSKDTKRQTADSVVNDLESTKTEFTEPEPETEYHKLRRPLGLEVLEDFEKNGEKRSKQVNDRLFIEFLKSFNAYQNEMNERLYDDSNYETYNTLIYADKEMIEPEAKEFEDSVKNLGFYVSASEGMIFLEKDPQFLKRFAKYLSEPMNTFRNQYSKEILSPMASDGGLIISTKEQIQRMLFWERFAYQHSDFELPNYANEQFKMYLFYLMFGMDNTPIHDWSDSLNIRPEVIKTYKQIIEEYPKSDAVPYLIDYLDFLEQKNFKYDRSFNEYGRRKFPDMYGK